MTALKFTAKAHLMHVLVLYRLEWLCLFFPLTKLVGKTLFRLFFLLGGQRERPGSQRPPIETLFCKRRPHMVLLGHLFISTHCGCELWAGSQRPRVTSPYRCSALLQGNCHLQHLTEPLTRSQAVIQQSWKMILMPVSVTLYGVCVSGRKGCLDICECLRTLWKDQNKGFYQMSFLLWFFYTHIWMYDDLKKISTDTFKSCSSSFVFLL